MTVTFPEYVPQAATGAREAQADQQLRDELRQQIRQSIQEAQRAAAEARRARAEAGNINPALAPIPPLPGIAVQGGHPVDVPPQVVDMAYGFFFMCAAIIIGWPIARAFGRRLERKGEVAAVSPAVTDQLQRIERAVEAMAIEVERISESQRFMAKLQSGSSAERV